MRIAQQLYEGVDIKGSGTVGLITYLRTDSTRISEEADAAVREYIKEGFGEEYVAEGDAKKTSDKKIIQDAHEAIRPTDVTRTPAAVKEFLSRISSVCISLCGNALSPAECSRRNMRPLLLRLQQDSTVLLLPHPKFHLKVSEVCTQKRERQKKRTMYY